MWFQSLGEGNSESVELKVQGRTQNVLLPKDQPTLLLIKLNGDNDAVVLPIPLSPKKA
jgi:hypothetical protein